MPQLDHVTYLSQFFWLFVCFLSFYVILVNKLLPKISSVLKMRRRLLSNEIVETTKTSTAIASEGATTYEQLVATSVAYTKDTLDISLKEATKWIQSNTESIHKTELAPAHAQYLNIVGELIAKKYVLGSILASTSK